LLLFSQVLDQPILKQVLVVTFIAILATVGVYGIVAVIVRMDDLGTSLTSGIKVNWQRIDFGTSPSSTYLYRDYY
jgi:predicted DNA repair protein MutK